MLNNQLLLQGATGYNLSKSLRFRSSASAYLSRTPASAGTRTTWTWSGWVKLGDISTSAKNILMARTGGSYYTAIYFNANNLYLDWFNGSQIALLRSAQAFRDPSAFYHVVIAIDSTNATSSNRVKMYVNGVEVTSFTTATYPSQNAQTAGINESGVAHWISSDPVYGGSYFDGYLTEVNFIDGQALTPSSFGSTNSQTGVWQPKKYAGTYGTNGFYLPFTDVATTSGSNAGLGKDFSGNGNYWTTNNISVTTGTTYDSMNDVPTLTSATASNYCVLSPIDTYDNAPTEGNLRRTGVGHGGSPWSSCRGTLGVSSGKWYFEATLTGSTGSVGNNMVGIMTTATSTLSDAYGGAVSRSYQANGGTQGDNPTGTVSSATSGDVIMCAFDIDAGKVWFGKNGTWFNSGVPASGTGNVFTSVPTTPVVPALHMYGNTGDNYGWFTNFGQRPFAYTPPTGFVALNTFNL